MMKDKKFNLHLPKRHAEDTPIVHDHLALKAVQEWKSKQSKSALSTSIKELYFLLRDLQDAHIPTHQRHDVLATLQPVLSAVSHSLQRLTEFEGINSEHHYLIADLMMNINMQMLQNYKILLEDELKPLWVNKKRLLFTLQYAMTQCVKILFFAYEQYRSPPAGLWSDLHALYLFAIQKRLVNKNVDKTPEWNFSYKNLGHLYKHCLLFYIANPYHFVRNELAQVKYALEAWAPLLELKKADPAISPLFGVDTTSDRPPQYALIQAQYSPNYCFLILDNITKRLLQLLAYKKNLKKNKGAQNFAPVELNLTLGFIEFLLSRWSAMQNKIGKREKIQGYIKACLGISASHWFLSKENLNLGNTDPENAPQSETLDVDALLRQHASLHAAGQDGKPQYQSYNCELINQSTGGFCLKWAANFPSQLQSGEIITLEQTHSENPGHWAIGTIRWLKQKEDQTALVGVQLLSTETYPAKARLIDAPASLPIPTLLLPEQPNQTIAMKTLVTPPLPFKTGQKVELEYNQERFIVTLQKNHSLSPTYQQFALEFESQQPEFPASDLNP